MSPTVPWFSASLPCPGSTLKHQAEIAEIAKWRATPVSDSPALCKLGDGSADSEIFTLGQPDIPW